MSVWFCIPSKRPVEELLPVLGLWAKQGYRLALWRDTGDEIDCADLPTTDGPSVILTSSHYPGYAAAVNAIVSEVIKRDPQGEWLVTGGDDVEPDANNTAEQIADSLNQHFASSWGVMQPTGDRWGDHRNTHTFTARPGPQKQMCSQCGRMQDNLIHSIGAYIDRVAGSPWMGREWCLRANQGRGPLWPEYFHSGVDEELQHVATGLGVFWQRRDLIHLHQHWGRNPSVQNNMPEFLKRANSAEEWYAYKKIFESRKAAGFPGSEPKELEKKNS